MKKISSLHHVYSDMWDKLNDPNVMLPYKFLDMATRLIAVDFYRLVPSDCITDCGPIHSSTIIMSDGYLLNIDGKIKVKFPAKDRLDQFRISRNGNFANDMYTELRQKHRGVWKHFVLGERTIFEDHIAGNSYAIFEYGLHSDQDTKINTRHKKAIAIRKDARRYC